MFFTVVVAILSSAFSTNSCLRPSARIGLNCQAFGKNTVQFHSCRVDQKVATRCGTGKCDTSASTLSKMIQKDVFINMDAFQALFAKYLKDHPYSAIDMVKKYKIKSMMDDFVTYECDVITGHRLLQESTALIDMLQSRKVFSPLETYDEDE